MTALTLPPSFTDADFRTVRMAAVRHVAELENAERITETDATARIGRLTQHNYDLTVEDRNAAHLQLRDALKKLAYVRSPMFDPADGDRDSLEYAADDDAENAIRKLVGGRR